MSRIAYVNGRFIPHNQASVHVEDRGYQFADGIYEVVMVLNGQSGSPITFPFVIFKIFLAVKLFIV